MSVCVRCQRSEDEADWKRRADVNSYGLSVCFRHEIELRSDLDLLSRLKGDDPEAEHGSIDSILEKWAPRPLAEAVEAAASRQPWWGCT